MRCTSHRHADIIHIQRLKTEADNHANHKVIEKVCEYLVSILIPL